jgi:hypothetical protein
MPVPTKVDITHYRGDTLGISLKVWADDSNTVPANFTGSKVVAQVRPTADSSEISGQFAVSISGNTLTLVLSPKQTREMGATNVWDVEVDWHSDDVQVQTVVAGTLSLTSDVTRVLTP